MNIVQNMAHKQAPVLAGVEISTDVEGRYNLNLLHRVSGFGKSKQPSNWLRLKSTAELIREISNSSDLRSLPVTKIEGVKGGTFAHELLAISYAGWISPAFQLKVNQVFIDYRTGRLLNDKPSYAIPQSFKEALKLLIEKEEETERLLDYSQEQTKEINDLKSFFKQGMTIPQFCKMLNGVNVMAVNEFLSHRNWLHRGGRSNKYWRVSGYARDRYLTEKENEISPHGKNSFIAFVPVVLKSGAQRIYELYRQGKLPMKKSWDGSFSHWKQENLKVSGVDNGYRYRYSSSRLQ